MMRRRSLLALAGGGLVVAVLPARAFLPVLPRRPAPTAEAALGWIRHVQGRYELWLPRTEMGQHIATALRQLACAELGVAWEQVQLRLPATTDIGRVKATVGSDSVREFALPLAQACATLRDALAAGAATGLLQAQPRTMAELRAFRPGVLRARGPAPLVQGLSIVRGEPLYAADMRLPGMLYGRVLRAEASPELASRVRGLREDAARAVPGFVALVRDPALRQGRAEGLGIVARTPGALARIEAALALQWEVEGAFDAAAVDALLDVDTHLRQGSLAHTVVGDRVDADAPWDVDLRLDIPFAAHAGIEPRAALAQWQPGTPGPALRLWAGTQDPFFIRDVVARALGLDEDAVWLQTCRVGGAFGGRTLCTVELEAAVLARAVQGVVKLQWTRAQELLYGFHRPACSHRVRARLRPDGTLGAWWHAFASAHILFTNAGMPPWMQAVSRVVGDAGVARGADMPYSAGARRVEFDLVRLPVLAGPWRGLGAGPNHLAIEMAVDALAARAGADPLAFRLAHVQDARLAQVLRRAAALAHWAAEPPAAGAPGIRVGRGLACGIYKQHSYAATVAEVQVEESTGAVRVTRLWCVHDCGFVLNPGQVRAQCEGNLVWGLGMVLVEGLAVEASSVSARNFGDAPVPRLYEVPPMEIELVEHDAPPGGAGETVIVAAAGAVANAVAAATGFRPSRLPLAAAQLLRHLQADRPRAA